MLQEQLVKAQLGMHGGSTTKQSHINLFIPFNICPYTVNCHLCGTGFGSRAVLIASVSCL